MTTENRVLSSISYLSIFFLPIIFPVVILAITTKSDYHFARHQAWIAFWIQLAIFILTPLAVLVGIWSISSLFTASQSSFASFIGLIGVLGLGLVDLTLFIYTIYRGIKIWVI